MRENANDTKTLSHFKRNSAQVMRQIKKSGTPLILTVKGKAEVVVQDADAYERLLALATKAEMVTFLREANDEADAGDVVPAREFIKSLGKQKKRRKA